MEINKETNINNQSNNKSDNKNENNIEGEKKVEISRNELNTKSDVNLNINNSFDVQKYLLILSFLLMF